MLEYSRKLNTEARKAKLEIWEKAMADLIALGWKDTDAYIALGRNQPVLSDEYNSEQIKIAVTDPDFAHYLKLRTAAVRRGGRTTADEDAAAEPDPERILTKEEVLQEMLRTAYMLPYNDPKRVDILTRYADLQQMKKDEVAQEDRTVHYYLPLSCRQCSLYQATQKKTKK